MKKTAQVMATEVVDALIGLFPNGLTPMIDDTSIDQMNENRRRAIEVLAEALERSANQYRGD